MRKNEISRISLQVRGRKVSTVKNTDIQNYYKIELNDLLTLLTKLVSKPPRFENSFVDIPDIASGKYQKIGLSKVLKKKEQGIEFIHFQAGYIYREKEELQKIDIDSKAIKKIKLGDKEYRYLTLHFSIIPSYNAIVIDNRCFNRPTAYFLKYLLMPLMKPSDYMLSSTADLDENFFTKIRYVPAKNFEQLLSTTLSGLKSVGFEIAKPGLMKLAAYEPEELASENKKYMGTMAQILSTFFQINPKDLNIEDIPFKKLRIQFSLDDGYKGSDLAPYKDGVKGFLTDNKNGAYLNETELVYKDSQSGELERALMSGGALFEANSLDVKHLEDETKMWKEQRNTFFKHKTYLSL